ncbi:MAG: MBL fold metallo-hydrolase [Eubacteriales bacterium]
MFTRKTFANLWEGRIEPFKIVGNVYFVGCFPASTHIIDTGDGLILIDPGYMSTLHLVIDGIHRLGFDPMNIKYIVNTHWHKDHTEATAALARLCGAKTLIGVKDKLKARKYFEADTVIKDGDTLRLGNTEIEFMETPGHTEGTISFFFETEENGKKYRVGMFGGAGANTMERGKFDFENCREAYVNSIHRLRKEKVDVFIGNHVWNNNTEEFGEILRAGGENKFIDGTLWTSFLEFCLRRVEDIIAKEKE